MVRGRRQELRQKVIVGTVDHNNFETGLLAAHGAVHKLLTHKGHIFLVHRLDVPQGPTIQRHIRGCKRRVAGGGIASPACMRQLHTHFCAILSGRTRHHLKAMNAPILRHIQLTDPCRGIRMHHRRIANGQISYAGFGLPCHVVQHFLRDLSLGRTFKHHRRRILQPVLKGHAPNR